MTHQATATAVSPRCYCRSALAEESQVGDCLVLYHRESRKAVALNSTGSWIWQLLPTHQTSPALSEQLRGKYPSLDARQAERDVVDYLRNLTDHGMVIAHD
jgi:hypothetical protein